jgi:uncharacterized protein YhbP (UPF0306 family)
MRHLLEYVGSLKWTSTELLKSESVYFIELYCTFCWNLFLQHKTNMIYITYKSDKHVTILSIQHAKD